MRKRCNARRERGDELHPTTTRATDDGRQLVGAAQGGDCRLDLRAGGVLLAGPRLFVLIVFFGAHSLVDGILAIVAGNMGSQGRSWQFVAEGVLAGLEVVSPPAHTDGR
jgi:hypothetical protein